MFLNVRGSDGGAASVADLLQATSEGARGESLADTPLTAADVLMLTGTVRFNLEDHDRSLEDLEKALELLAPHRASSPAELSRVHWELARHARRKGDSRPWPGPPAGRRSRTNTGMTRPRNAS